MFGRQKQTSTFYKITKNNDTICFTSELQCVSDVLVLDKKRYIRLKIEGGLLEFLRTLDNYCNNNFEKFSSSISNDTILVKLPFRYNKYEIDYIGQASSDDFRDGALIKSTIEVTGVVMNKYSSMCTFKLTKLGVVQSA